MLISTVVMFQVQNRETINSTGKVTVSFKIMTMSVTRLCFTTQHQTCKTKIKTTVCKTKTKTKTDFLVWDRSCRKTDGLSDHVTGLCYCSMVTTVVWTHCLTHARVQPTSQTRWPLTETTHAQARSVLYWSATAGQWIATSSPSTQCVHQLTVQIPIYRAMLDVYSLAEACY